jgi:hypothetical protein
VLPIDARPPTVPHPAPPGRTVETERVEASPELAIAGVEVKRAKVPELEGAAQLAAVETERVESHSTGQDGSTGWSTAVQGDRGFSPSHRGALSRLRSGAGER